MNKFKQIAMLLALIIIGVFFLRHEIGNKSSEESSSNILSGFEDKKTWGISPERGFYIKVSRDHVTEGKYALEVTFPKEDLASINTKKLKQTWGDYEYFAFDVYNPQKDNIDFAIRIDDVHKKRINIDRQLLPGLNKISIPRAQLSSKIDAGQIYFVVLYLKEPSKRYRLFFDNMRLERSDLIKGIESEVSPTLPSTDVLNVGVSVKRQAAVLPTIPVEKTGELKVAFARIKEVGGAPVFVSMGVPFAPGQLDSVDNFVFYDNNGKEIPLATKILARWPQDQSIRSVLVQLHYPIPQRFEYVTFKWGVKRTVPDGKIVEPTWDFPEGIIIMPAEWLCHSQVIGEQIPFGRSASGLYDQNILKYFPGLLQQPKTGNIRLDGYYSTPHVFYQLFVRTGELKYFLAARKEALYYRENEIVHEGPDKGAARITAKQPRYIYVDAMADDYFLTGDPRTREVAGYMTDFLITRFPAKNAYLPKNDSKFWTERNFAYPFLGAMMFYEISLDKKYLKAAEEYMANLYRTQLEWPTRGGFIHNLYSHDTEEGARPDEYGGSPFMTGLLLEAIIEYHRITNSDIAADSIFRALDWLIKEALVASKDAFVYMTADKYANSDGVPDLNLLIVHGFGYGYRLSGYEREDYLEIGQRVFERGIEEGFLRKQKQFNQSYRSSGYYLAYIQEGLRQRAEKGMTQSRKLEEPTALQPTSSSVLLSEGFDEYAGRFSASQDTQTKIDSQNKYLNGNALHIQSRYPASTLSAGVYWENWDIEQYPIVSFSYRIPKDVPVGIRVKTGFGDWICLGGTKNSRCDQGKVKKNIILVDDDAWHEIDLDVLKTVQSLLPGVKRLEAFQFYTYNNAQESDQFWVDDFRIRK